MINEGQITIACTLNNTTISDVCLTSTRPLELTQNLLGYDVESFLETIPRVFSVCGIAQVVAAQRALNNQTMGSYETKLSRSQDLLIQLETIREQVFRIGVQWPQLFDLATPNLEFKRLNDCFTKIKSTLFFCDGRWHWNELNTFASSDISLEIKMIIGIVESQLFNDQLANWMSMESLDDLNNWCNANPCLISLVIATIMQSDLQIVLPDTLSLEHIAPSNSELEVKFKSTKSADFIYAPQWHSQCCETGPASRLSHPLMTELSDRSDYVVLRRYVARLMELAINIDNLLRLIQLEETQTPLYKTDGTGVAQVQAARGLLIHYAKVTDHIVEDYKILAPTEWNFHPQGLVTQGLNSLTSNDSSKLEQYSRWFIESVDPCVAYELRMN